jgi:hypothetical protein
MRLHRLCVGIAATVMVIGGGAGAAAAHHTPPSVTAAEVAERLFGMPALGPARLPRLLAPHGSVLFPTTTIRATYGVRLSLATVPAAMEMPTPPRAHLRAYVLPLGGRTLLAVAAPPSVVQHALVGADGSYGFTLVNPSQALRVSSDGACQGCAMAGGGVWFPALARAWAKQTGIPPSPFSISRLKGLIAYRYVGPRLLVYAFHTAHGRVTIGFVAAPLTVSQLGGTFYTASWTGPAHARRLGDYEVAVAYRVLSHA